MLGLLRSLAKQGQYWLPLTVLQTHGKQIHYN